MDKQTSSNSFKKLLDRLQEDSWQLELLVSGFTIFGLFSALDPAIKFATKAQVNNDNLTYKLAQTLLLAIFILIFNLLLHLVLRSLWIGALGLRSVSGEIEIEKLNYTDKFNNYLKRKVGSFDNYIKKLEEFSSVIFAISFLLIFYVIAFFITLYLPNLFNHFLSNTESKIINTIGTILTSLFLFGAFLTFFDFITLGLLKKKKWSSKVYYPFYIFFSFITLSFLYRPLSYNLLDNKFGRKISLLLLPVYISILIISSLYNKNSNYINKNSTQKSNSIITNSRSYEDLVEKDDSFIDVVAIQSKIISDSYVKITVPIWSKIDDIVFQFNKGLKPDKDSRGYKTSVKVRIGKNSKNKLLLKQKQDSLRKEYLKTFNKIHLIKIDSVTYKSDFLIANRNNKKLSLETYIGIKNLSEGKHILSFLRYIKPTTDSLVSLKKIPFWYYKN